MYGLASMGSYAPWQSYLMGNSVPMNSLLDINTGYGIGPLASKVSTPNVGAEVASANGASGVTNSGLSMGQGILGGLRVATDIFNVYNQYKNYKLQKEAYNFQKGLLEEQMGRQRHEWARQDKNRANITNAWNNGKSYSNSLAGSGINNNTQAI